MNEMTGGDWVSLVIALGAIAGFIIGKEVAKRKVAASALSIRRPIGLRLTRNKDSSGANRGVQEC